MSAKLLWHLHAVRFGLVYGVGFFRLGGWELKERASRMRLRLLAVDNDLAGESLNERRQYCCRGGCSAIRPRSSIPFQCAPHRATLLTSVSFEPSTRPVPNPPCRLESRKLSLLGADRCHVVLVSPKETRPGRVRRRQTLSQPETSRSAPSKYGV